MARPRVSPEVLAQKGVPLTLNTGRVVTICYTFRALMMLEERYGSVSKAMERVANFESAAGFTSLAGILACGLGHETADVEPGTSGDGNALSDATTLADYLDTAKLEEYSDAMGAAFTKAFPQGDNPVDPPVPTDPTTETTPSPGESGIGSLSSGSDSPMPSSGA